MNIKKALNSKKFRYGGIAMLFTVIIIAVIIVLNLLVESMTERFNLKQDITAEGIYSVSDTTIDMLENLTEDITVYIMLTESEVTSNSGYNTANELLKKMVGYSGGRLSLEYVDLLVNPNFRNNFENPDAIFSGTIIMKSSKREQIIDINDLYDTSYDFNTGEEYVSGYQADRKFASAVHYVTTEELPSAAYTTGHGEIIDNASLTGVFTSNSYSVGEVALLTEDIPEDLDMLIINAPSTDFSEEEIEKLNEFLTRSTTNSLIVTYNAQAGELERLYRYLTEWGVDPSGGIIVDAERAAGANAAMFVADLNEHDITTQIPVDAVIVPGATNLEVLWDTEGYRSTNILAQSSGSAYVEGDESLDAPFPVVVLTQDNQYVDNESIIHNVLFIGGWEMTSEYLLDNSAFQNNNLLTASLDFMNPSVDAVLVDAVDFTNTQMIVTGNTAIVILILTVIILPLAFIVIGIAVFLRRKNK